VVARQPRTPLRLRPDRLRKCSASLALILGWIALARRSGNDLALLQKLQNRMRRSKQGRPAHRSATTDAEDLQQLSRKDGVP